MTTIEGRFYTIGDLNLKSEKSFAILMMEASFQILKQVDLHKQEKYKLNQIFVTISKFMRVQVQ